MPITAEQQVKQYRIDRTKGRGGTFAITDEHGRVESVIVTEEAMANQSRQLLTPIVDGLIYPGSVGLVAAPPKAGKSNLAFMLSHELAAGRDYLGYRVKEKCCVLIAEFEEGDSVMAARYQRFPDDDAFFENGELGIQYTPAPFEFVEDAAGAITVDKSKGLGRQIYLWHDQICQELFPERSSVVFIDTMARALPTMGGGKYTSDLNYIGAVHALAEELGIAIVFIHHTNKAEHADAADSISGTNGVAGSCDWMMVVFRDNDPETKQRLSTGRLVCNSRYMSEDELLRWVKLSDHGFWELDFERESAEEMKRRVAREKEIPRCVRKIRTLMNKNDKWAGTATDLAKALNDDTAPQALTRKLNASQEWLAEQGIHYWNDRINKRRLLHFEVVAAPTEQVEIIPAEVDFSGSIPNPYVGKVRRETMDADMDNENGKVVTDEMIAEWEGVLERDEWPNGWANVGEVVEGKLPKGKVDVPEDYIPAEFDGIENEPFPEWYNPADRTVVMNITARVGEAEADDYMDAIRILRDTCATQDEKVQARIIVGRISRAMGDAGMEVPTQADAVAGNWPKSLIGHIVNGEEV
jgi:hypothetical protein